MNTDPIRLLSQSDLTASERSALEAAELGVAAGYDFARGEARLLAGLAILPKPGVPGQSSLARLGAAHGVLHSLARLGARFDKLGLKILLGLTLGLALMGTAYVLSARSSVRLRAPKRVSTQPSVLGSRARGHASTTERALPPLPVVTSLAPSEPGLETAPPVRREARRSDSRQSLRARPKARFDRESSQPAAEATNESATDPRAELRAIAQAKALSERDPQGALRLLEQIRVQFPRGYFGEERAALTILTLARNGQSALARQQASDFLGRYPNGPHSDRVRRVVEARPVAAP